MNESAARAWLEALARAWRARDADAMAALFTEDAESQTDPFEPIVRERENLRIGFALWMQDQSDIRMDIGNIDVIDNRFYAQIDAEWTVISTRGRIQERGLLVCDMVGDRARVMREFWTSRKG